MFTARTVSVIARPGNSASHHSGLNLPTAAPESMVPQLGAGGGTPTPTKLSAASVVIAMPSEAVKITRNGATQAGAMWRTMIRSVEAPATLAESTYTISLVAMATERITRVLEGMRVTAMAIITV